MEIFELAAQLGKVLKEDERLVRMAKAKEAYENDMSLRTLMREYQVQQLALEKTAGQKDVEARFLEMIQDRINDLYNQIIEHPVYVELEAAQNDVNALMNAVNNTIMYEITGEMPSSCTHDCSTCGGGCSH
ncbi:MAG: YlbF family regulator [Clostridia bacterium]|nr:YlbF family regulator [Clostridia bacterium]